MRACRTLVVAGVLSAAASFGQSPDPRSAEGQLAVCGGAAAWQAIGYLEFSVRTEGPAGVDGPWVFHWDRRNNYFRVIGTTTDGAKLDLALDIGSRSGGGSKDGKPLLGNALAEQVNWAFSRFGEELLWLTFPLEWTSAGVKVVPGADATSDNERFLTTRVSSRAGDWLVWLDPTTGRIARTQSAASAGGVVTVWWSEWKAVAGVYFASVRKTEETHTTATVDVVRALPFAPSDAF